HIPALSPLSAPQAAHLFNQHREPPHTDKMLPALCTLFTALSCVSGVIVVTQKPPVLTATKGEKITMHCNLGTVTTSAARWYKQVPGGVPHKCVEDVTTTKTVTCYPNQKPWLNGDVRSPLKARDAAFRRNRSTDDAISSVVHTALTHLERKDSYVCMLFVDFTSAFNTMIPQTLTDKLSSLGLRSSLCNWVLDFLTNRPQSVRIHNLSSSTTILSTGSP
ncbi:hypothetical protein NFI96_024227, partial [Prochilodus magdalenae]